MLKQEEVAPTAVAISGEEERALLTKADTARALGKHDEARELYEQAAAISQGGTRAHLELVEYYRSSNQQDNAKQVLQKAYALNPQNTEVLKEYAQQLLAMGQNAEAEKIAAEGLAQSPNDVRLLNAMGVAHDRSAEHSAAQEYYAQALRLSDSAINREYSANNLALSYVATGDYDKAITVLEPALKTSQNKPALRQLLAMAYGAKGNTDKAYELGLIDLNVKQVNDNLEFYRQLRMGTADTARLFEPAAR